MTEEEKKAIEISKISLCVAHKYDKRNMIYNTASLETILDLIEKQQKEIKELKLITNTYDSYEGKDMDHTKIIIADSNYFVNGTFVNKFISKDKIREIFINKRNEIIFIKNRNERLYKVKILDEIEKELLGE